MSSTYELIVLFNVFLGLFIIFYSENREQAQGRGSESNLGHDGAAALPGELYATPHINF